MKLVWYIFIISGLVLSSNSVHAQKKAYKIQKRQRNHYDAYPNPFEYRKSEWIFDAGATGTFGLDSTTTIGFADTSLTYSGQLRPGINLAVGRYLSFKGFHKVIKYVDATLGYKMLWNTEKQTLAVNSIGYSESLFTSNAAHYVSLNGNINNVINVSNYSFIQNSIGINLEYRFGESVFGEEYTHSDTKPTKFVAQFHYKFGWGFLLDGNKFLIPYIEIPFLTITPKGDNFSQLYYFNESFQSVIIGVRLFLFTPGQKSCPTVKN